MNLTNNQKYPTAVVTELGIAGLGIIRTLGKRGIPVIGIDSKLSNYGALSRYCKPLFCSNVNDFSLIETLLSLGETLDQKAAIICASDLSVLIVSRYRRLLEKSFTFVLPSNDVINILMNKRLFYDFALKHGFAVPKTVFTHNTREVESASRTITYPLVIKPEVRDDYWYQHVPAKHKVIFVSSEDHYFEVFNKYNISDRPLIIQEWIQGSDHDVYFCLAYIDKNFEPVVVFTGKKIRQNPIFTGVTSAAQSYWEPFIARESLRLLSLAGCIGFCSVEFKFCHKDKIFKITEPTVGRPDMQEAIVVSSGINVPYIAYLDALGISHTPQNNFREGVKWFCEPMEIYSIPATLRSGLCNINQIFASYAGPRSYALMDMLDPLPFRNFLCKTFRARIKRILPQKIK